MGLLKKDGKRGKRQQRNNEREPRGTVRNGEIGGINMSHWEECRKKKTKERGEGPSKGR